MAKSARNAKNTKVPKDAKGVQETLTVEDISRAAKATLSDLSGTAQDPSKDVSLGKTCENGPIHLNLSDLSDLRTTSPSTAPDACPGCGGWNWYSSPNGTLICTACLYRASRVGLRLDGMAAQEAARREREMEIEVRLAMGWYRTDCARCQRPLWDRTPDEILAGADLCAECDLPLQDLQWLRE